MVNRKEFISRIFSRDTVVEAVKSLRPAESSSSTKEKFGKDESQVHIPELTGEMVYFEAMKLGIDPSNYTVEELKKKVFEKFSAAGQ